MRVSTVNLESSGLVGYISPVLGNLSSLEVLDMSNNSFHGVIPDLGQKLSNLKELHLWGNQLIGPIPTSLGNCSKLKFLDLGLNNLNGSVPLQLGKLSSLQRLFLYDNFLTSSRDLPFLTALINCSSLKTLYLGYNHLAEDLSPSIGNLSTQLSVLSLQQNLIGGRIPQEIGNLTKLIMINFTGNALTGPIPSELKMLEDLERLYLGQNKLQGPIPWEIGDFSRSLGLLSLSFNQLSGQIPPTIGKLTQLRHLQLNNNKFNGTIPLSLGNCQLLELVDLSHNNLTGNIPREVAGLNNLQFYFNLSWNSLHGSLPAEITKLVMVQGIDLSGNQLSGEIPIGIGSCTNLEYLNLSHNKFEGPIPLSISRLQYLEIVDLSYNNKLSGKIPKREPFRNLTAPPFKVEPRLCGEGGFLYPGCPIAGSPGEAPEGSPGGLRDLHNLFKYMIYAIPSLVIYCLYIFFLYKYTFPKKNVEPSMQFPHPRISYKELSTATNGFDKANLLGVGSVGSVYKGVLDAGTLIAVKVLNLENEAAHKSFNTECQVLSKTRHRNIIKAITSCSNLDFKGLVFEFMANGNLERHLHCAGNCNFGDVCKMNLQTRLQIATDVARGLAYLHHDCSIQVVHCDLKPNNILLDFNMTTRIADFGNAQILSENSMISFSASTTLKGAPGYIAPVQLQSMELVQGFQLREMFTAMEFCYWRC
ncbi:putative leucine-rich repeat receptor-like serine/threonine-protein kinase At2g24130 isoform X2 [Cryptomeria japonica]|uniref:putative leucine-rich repeat receptor-like serine/threonine-protein kinase At2g24130 isoform X2 n=1 Tax=Cryptomeria japonica TaxID=3369 RepID=UPI0027DAA6FE|nr:putative leucine-rich repeat receptor-like serine/threonine-protein kinase At2g24130 isoform X2 [Cryptomeria japonica]